MADFCRQCALEYPESDPTALSGLISAAEFAKNGPVWTLCDGCGICLVDPAGTCLGQCDDATHSTVPPTVPPCPKPSPSEFFEWLDSCTDGWEPLSDDEAADADTGPAEANP